MDRSVEERRTETRFRPEADADVSARIRHGHRVDVVNLSPAGALIQGTRPLPPGMPVVLQLQRGDDARTMPAHVVRSTVFLLEAGCVIYRAALRFEGRCGWICEYGTPDEYLLPGPGPSVSGHPGKPLPGLAAEECAHLAEGLKP